jgi:DNA invertase Pin-like site-specific DNA recombinase
MERTDGMYSRTRKLTDTDVAEIRRLVASGVSKAQIAARYSVSRQQISNIDKRECWKETT